MLRPVDSFKDRLSRFYHWNDLQGLEEAISICLDQTIDLIEVETWSEAEAQKEKYQHFIQLLKERKA